MTSLAEAYGATGRGRRRLYLGTALFGTGAIMVVAGIVIASTDLLVGHLGVFGAREAAGILAGLGIPAVFIGVFSVLPASGAERAVAAIGACVTVLGVLLFWQVYPEQWYGATANHLTLPVVAVYFLGAITTFWGLFTAVVNFKTRNDPGGTVTLERIIRRVQGLEPDPEPAPSPPQTTSGSGVGVLGDVDREPVMADQSESDAEVMAARASDGGTAAAPVRTPEPSERSPAESSPDRYCGTCGQFDYIRTDAGMQPYCGYYDEFMDDMDPCEHWAPNRPG